MGSPNQALTDDRTSRFALIGGGGYVAPRHMKAIHETGHDLVAMLDVNDSVGIIDDYFPSADFFVEFERFDRHVDKLRRSSEERRVDFVSVCSPNYLHDSHIRFALRSGADAICEKPLVLNPWNLDGLTEIARDTGKKVNSILQLRLHPAIGELRDKVNSAAGSGKFEVDLTYITARGRWYLVSWKGDERKSGGVATNIGVHFYDMLHFVFGELQENRVHYNSRTRAAGYLEYKRARVRWFLSVEAEDLAHVDAGDGQRTYRNILIDGEQLDFTRGFADLHTESYRRILAGEGFGIEENRVAIETVSKIRRSVPEGPKGEYHPLLRYCSA